jgi:hypothetical protein
MLFNRQGLQRSLCAQCVPHTAGMVTACCGSFAAPAAPAALHNSALAKLAGTRLHYLALPVAALLYMLLLFAGPCTAS